MTKKRPYPDKLLPKNLQGIRSCVTIEPVVKVKVECEACGNTEEDELESEDYLAAFIEGLYKQGWREAELQTFAVDGMVCKECAGMIRRKEPLYEDG